MANLTTAFQTFFKFSNDRVFFALSTISFVGGGEHCSDVRVNNALRTTVSALEIFTDVDDRNIKKTSAITGKSLFLDSMFGLNSISRSSEMLF